MADVIYRVLDRLAGLLIGKHGRSLARQAKAEIEAHRVVVHRGK